MRLHWTEVFEHQLTVKWHFLQFFKICLTGLGLFKCWWWWPSLQNKPSRSLLASLKDLFPCARFPKDFYFKNSDVSLSNNYEIYHSTSLQKSLIFMLPSDNSKSFNLQNKIWADRKFEHYFPASDCNFLANLSFTRPRVSPIFLTRLHETTRPGPLYFNRI